MLLEHSPDNDDDDDDADADADADDDDDEDDDDDDDDRNIQVHGGFPILCYHFPGSSHEAKNRIYMFLPFVGNGLTAISSSASRDGHLIPSAFFIFNSTWKFVQT